MKSLAGVLSLSLWGAAVLFTPAPAAAVWALYPSNINYWSCSQYQNITQQRCYVDYGDGFGADVLLYGKMNNTVPISTCSGSCNGSANLLVETNPGNGRKMNNTPDWPYLCGNSYLLDIGPCSTCS